MLRGLDQKVKHWKNTRIAGRKKQRDLKPRVGKAGDTKCSVLVPQGTKREKTDYIEGKILARLIMGNLISWLASRNGCPGQCMCELTISSGEKNRGQQECQVKNKTNSSSHTAQKVSLYQSHTYLKNSTSTTGTKYIK